ncbi:hypothetical protein P4639_22380 [Priestia megaterium]|uniref:hypothetical protein n=1 Tax=Priestia megaterium TaxID=1404 RepID=UPI002E1DC119|nr:hypothetical protein [Priestia megaterium]
MDTRMTEREEFGLTIKFMIKQMIKMKQESKEPYDLFEEIKSYYFQRVKDTNMTSQEFYAIVRDTLNEEGGNLKWLN